MQERDDPVIFQTTVRETLEFSGIGVHSGAAVRMEVRPAPAGAGVRFLRCDLVPEQMAANEETALIPARFDHAVDTRLCTILSNRFGARVATVEHVLAALYGMGVDNALIALDGEEVPIMDGSATPFVDAVQKAGLVPLSEPRRMIRILKDVSVVREGARARLSPCDGFEISCHIEYDEGAIGHQSYSARLRGGVGEKIFARALAPARTFGLRRDIDTLLRNGFGRGGSLQNAIIVDGDGIVNETPLRFADEFVRHKALDVVGDLSLSGGFLLARYEGVRMGHSITNHLLRQLFSDTSAWRIESASDEPASTASLGLALASA